MDTVVFEMYNLVLIEPECFFYRTINNPNTVSPRFMISLHRVTERQSVSCCGIKSLLMFLARTFITQSVQFNDFPHY